MPVPQLSLQNSDPTVQDLLNAERKRVKLELNCHAVGVVAAFDPVRQTAQVAIAYSQTYFKLTDPITLTYLPYTVPYPVLLSAPVMFPGGGGPAGAVLTFPLAPGDEVLVCFNDRDIDTWWATGTPGGPNATARLHSFSDAIVVPGLRSQPRAIPDLDVTFGGVRDFAGAVEVGVDLATHLARIATLTGGTLGTQVQALLAGLSTFATAGAAASTALAAASVGPLSPLAPGHTALAAAFTALSTAVAASVLGFAEVIE